MVFIDSAGVKKNKKGLISMMMPNWNVLPFRPRALGIYIACALGFVGYYASAEEVQFNTDVLDVKDRDNIDLGQFSRGSYIMPGDYMMLIRINKQELPEQSVIFYQAENDANDSAACISPAMVEQFGLKPDMKEKLTWWHQGECLTLDSLPGTSARADRLRQPHSEPAAGLSGVRRR